MNNNIKKTVIILILSTIFISQIYSKEIVITIPKQFNSSSLPLPPFPKEVVNRLAEEDYGDELLENTNIKEIKQERIVYSYYKDFLNRELSNKTYMGHIGKIYSDFDIVESSYINDIFNNSFIFSSFIQYEIDQMDYNFYLKYRDFRLPVDVAVKAEYDNYNISMNLGYKDYYLNLNIEPEYDKHGFHLGILYSDTRGPRPLLTGFYDDMDSHYGAVALGLNFSTGDFRIGPSLINRSFWGYIDLNLNNGPFIGNIDTELEEDIVDYLGEIGYKSSWYIKLGGGVTINEIDSTYKPYISFKENFLLGFREYRIYQERILTSFNFIKDSFTSIISIDIDKLNKFSLSVENKKYNRYSFKSSLSYDLDEDDFSGSLEFEYKVGKK